jgi:hypothetical protein
MPRYHVYRFEPIPQGEIECSVREQTEALFAAGLLPERLRGVTLHGGYANGNYTLYDPSTEPETPLLLLKKIASSDVETRVTMDVATNTPCKD